MFNAEERKLRPAFEDVANEMYGGDATEFLAWTDDCDGEYEQQDVNAAFRAFVEGYRLGKTEVGESHGQQKPGERTDSDYAIEFGGYLADAVMQYLKARNAFDEKESTQGCDEGDADLLNDCRRALINAVGEFRKRAERAKDGADTRELREALLDVLDMKRNGAPDRFWDEWEIRAERVLAQGEPR